jgi:hypothetical protein
VVGKSERCGKEQRPWRYGILAEERRHVPLRLATLKKSLQVHDMTCQGTEYLHNDQGSEGASARAMCGTGTEEVD